MTTLRQQLALTAQAVLQAAGTLAGANVFLWRDWPLNTANIPALRVRARRLDREDLGGGNAVHFREIVWLEIDGFAGKTGVDPVQAEEDAETLEDEVIAAVLGWFMAPPRLFRRISQMGSDLDIDASGENHLSTLNLRFAFEVASVYGAPITDRLEEMRIVAISCFEVGKSQVTKPLTKVLAGADFPVPQNP